jgi:hypothetical protein
LGRRFLSLLATCDQQPLDGGGKPGGGYPDARKQAGHAQEYASGKCRSRPAAPGFPPVCLQMFNGYREAARYDLVVDWATLPEHSELYVAFEAAEEPVLAASREELKAAGAELTEDHHELFPRSLAVPLRAGGPRASKERAAAGPPRRPCALAFARTVARPQIHAAAAQAGAAGQDRSRRISL